MSDQNLAAPKTDSATDTWFTPREVKFLLRVGIRTIYREIRAGRLKAIKANGRDLRISSTAIADWALSRAAKL